MFVCHWLTCTLYKPSLNCLQATIAFRAHLAKLSSFVLVKKSCDNLRVIKVAKQSTANIRVLKNGDFVGQLFLPTGWKKINQNDRREDYLGLVFLYFTIALHLLWFVESFTLPLIPRVIPRAWIHSFAFRFL